MLILLNNLILMPLMECMVIRRQPRTLILLGISRLVKFPFPLIRFHLGMRCPRLVNTTLVDHLYDTKRPSSLAGQGSIMRQIDILRLGAIKMPSAVYVGHSHLVSWNLTDVVGL
jgi:hypothetical protein